MNKFSMLFLILMISACSYMAYNLFNTYKYEGDIKVGNKYLQSYQFRENQDPFEEIKIDTVEVLDMKDGYVKFKLSYWSDGAFLSAEEEVLRRIIKDIE